MSVEPIDILIKRIISFLPLVIGFTFLLVELNNRKNVKKKLSITKPRTGNIYYHYGHY